MAKQGKSLSEMAQEIERQNEVKRDFIAPVSKTEMVVHERSPVLLLDNKHEFPLMALAHTQLATYTGIPAAYYRRLQENDPQLLANNVNRWLREPPAEGKPIDRRMVRTLDGRVRAFLSDKFRPLDNYDLAKAVLPVLNQLNLLVLSCEITERNLYIKCVDRSIERSVPTGRKMGDGSHCLFDTCCPAIIIRNSEVGEGTLVIEFGVWTRACTNLAAFGACMRKYHTGKRAEISEDVYALLSDQTKRLSDAAVWSQARDLVKAAFDAAKFEATCKQLGTAAEQKLPTEAIPDVIEIVGKRFAFNQDETKGVLQRLIEGGDLTRYGLHAAVTNFSQSDTLDYERATELERVGGKIIELSNNEWEELAAAA